MNESAGKGGPALGLYIHWPFCLAKCPYCDFNSHIRHGGINATVFGEALIRELAHFAQRTPSRTVASIFFGGGTPSLMPPQVVDGIIDAAARHWPLDPDIEITLEANPTSAEAANFRGYRSAGVNRVSLGVQALDDAALHFLGRQHSQQEALAAFRMASKIFPRTSFDMIYARPGQSIKTWRDELSRALCEQNGHMSLYQLTIEPGTPFAQLHTNGKLQVPSDGIATDLYDATQELTTKAGLAAYEISNHAAPGHESRHNTIYWSYGEYAGIGPGAHSRLINEKGRCAIQTEKSPERWRALVDEHGHGIIEETALSQTQAGQEYVLMGLRHSQGIDPAVYTQLSSRNLDTETIDELVAAGLLSRLIDGRICASPKGRLVLNAISRELLV